MPIVRIDHATGRPASYCSAISRDVHDAMVSTFDVPYDDHFQVIGEHGPGSWRLCREGFFDTPPF